VVLEAEVSFAGHIFVGGSELISGSRRIGIFAGFGPAIQVHIDDVLAVEIYINLIVQTSDDIVVPLTGFFDSRF
jgi:hypothetical protein